jgi:hypothetical protein
MQKLTHFETQQVANTAAYVTLEHEIPACLAEIQNNIGILGRI